MIVLLAIVPGFIANAVWVRANLEGTGLRYHNGAAVPGDQRSHPGPG
jgi:hypothetical protein